MDQKLNLVWPNGSDGFIVNGELYHSRFGPVREAERFLDTIPIRDRTICVLVAPGMPFLEQQICARWPEITCLVLQPAEFAPLVNGKSEKVTSHVNTATWVEGQGSELSLFLSEHIDDTDVSRIEMIIWPPAQKHFPDFCNRVGTNLSNFVKLASANQDTIAFFGRRWLRNSYSNLGNLSAFVSLPRSEGNLVLVGAGPGLEDCLAVLAKYRERYILWALSSALRALGHSGISPDVIVSSDAGYWAGRHLEYISGLPATRRAPIVLAPTRAMLRPFWSNSTISVGLFSLDLPLENQWASDLAENNDNGILLAHLPDRGTVAITAMDLVRKTHRGSLYLIGMDFAWKDVQSHVRPHTFSELAANSGSRISGLENQLFVSREQRPSRPAGKGWYSVETLDIYRKWLAENQLFAEMPIFDYNPSGVYKSLPEIGFAELSMALSQGSKITFLPGDRIQVVSSDYRKKLLRQKLEMQADELTLSDLNNSQVRLLLCMLCPFAFRKFQSNVINEKELRSAAKASLMAIGNAGTWYG